MGLGPAKPKEEFDLWHSIKQEIRTFAEFIGLLPGFVMKSVFNSVYPDQSKGKDVYLQGSPQMDSLSRQYYERNLGAGMFVSAETENGLVGYSEPLRRLIQHGGFTPQVNEIQNTMQSWIPGEEPPDHFQKGDPYVEMDEGYARQPGAGYRLSIPSSKESIQKDYLDITKLSVLGDVAPCSREYNRIRAILEKQTHGDN